MSFQKLNLIEPILSALQSEAYITPTPIQLQAIPHILNKRDILGCAQTGTGKTAAFAIPIIQLLLEEVKVFQSNRPIKALILTPTRELAIQIGESFSIYGKHTKIKNTVIFGGVNQYNQAAALRSGIDVLVATPGRLIDLINQKIVQLKDIQFFVLDEADRMLDMGFINDVKKVITHLPRKRQSLFFSATMPKPIVELANAILLNPASVEIKPQIATENLINQMVYFVDKENKMSLLTDILENTDIHRALIFTRTKHGANRLAKGLNKAGIKSQAIHGNKSQSARQDALNNFKLKITRILVATDIAARGIDIDELTHVINYELPNMPEWYVHRIGRTGRAGSNGIAIAFCDAGDKEYLKDIQKFIGKQIPVCDEHNYPLMNHNVAKTPAKAQRPPKNINNFKPKSENARRRQTVANS